MSWFSGNPFPPTARLPWMQEEYLWEDFAFAFLGRCGFLQCWAMFPVSVFFRGQHQLSSSPPVHKVSRFMLRKALRSSSVQRGRGAAVVSVVDCLKVHPPLIPAGLTRVGHHCPTSGLTPAWRLFFIFSLLLMPQSVPFLF